MLMQTRQKLATGNPGTRMPLRSREYIIRHNCSGLAARWFAGRQGRNFLRAWERCFSHPQTIMPIYLKNSK